MVNEDDNTIVQFAIGNDGKLYPQNTYNTPGVFPVAVAVGGNRSLRGGYLSAATDLLSGLSLLGIHCLLSGRKRRLARALPR